MTQAEIQALINQIVTNGNYTANQLRPLLTALNTNASPATFGSWDAVIGTPTNGGIVTPLTFTYQSIGTSVVIGGMFTVELEASSTSSSFTISLDSVIEPVDDWADTLQVNAAVSRRNGAITGVCRILSDSGTKLLKANISDTSVGAVVDISFVATFKLS
jgi:hypothetical protein